MHSDDPRSHPAARLRALMDAGPVPAPGAFNGLVARAVARAGFPAAYVSGGATSAAAGVPDIGLLTLDRFAQVVREVVDASGLPVLADADTGFGEAEMVRRTVIEYHRAGSAGLHIEDQVFPKRCGHLDGKELLPVDDAATKIAWAAEASREVSDGQMLVCARTDARGVEGLDAAIGRAVRYVEAGASMLFPEGLHDEAEFAAFRAGLERSGVRVAGSGGGVYLLANMTEFGKTPHIPLARFGELGYHLVIYPVTTLRVAMRAVESALATLRDAGTAATIEPSMQTRAELYDLLGYRPGTEWRCPTGG